MYSQHSAALTAPQHSEYMTVFPESGDWPFFIIENPSNPNIVIDANIPAGIPEDNPYVSYQPPTQHSNLVIDATLVGLVVVAIVVGAAATAKEFVIHGAVMGIASIAPIVQ